MLVKGVNLIELNAQELTIQHSYLDSGGPLTCDDMLVGLASFGSLCGRSPDFPGVFADVYFYRDWINENSLANKTHHSVHVIIIGLASIFFTLLSIKSF